MHIYSKNQCKSLVQNARTTLEDEVIKFLYACLEDIEMERIAKLPVESVTIR